MPTRHPILTIILVLALLAAVVVGVSTENTNSVAAPLVIAGGRQVSNVSDVAATVSWLTDAATTGQVRYGPTTALGSVAQDDRGSGVSAGAHHVTLDSLMPATLYYYDLVMADGAVVDNNGGVHYTFQTGPSVALTPPDSVYGQVMRSDGVTPAEGAIVYIYVRDGDASGSTGQSSLLSSLVEATGYWNISLTRARLPDLSGHFEYSAGGDSVHLYAEGGSQGVKELEVDTANDAPAATMVLEPAPTPTPTPTFTDTPTPTHTFTPEPTDTPTPTPTYTFTPIPPTDTPTPTYTFSPTPTFTHTFTPIPPTDTPTPSGCSATPPVPVLQAPPNAVSPQLTVRNVAFDWADAPCAQTYRIYAYMKDATRTATPVVKQTNLTSSSFVSAPLQAGKTYLWKANTCIGTVCRTSNTWTFAIATTAVTATPTAAATSTYTPTPTITPSPTATPTGLTPTPTATPTITPTSPSTGSKTKSFQNGAAPNAKYTGAIDTYVSEAQSTTNFGTVASLIVSGSDPAGTGKDKWALLKWNLSTITGIVQSVSLTLNITDHSGGQSYELYEALATWSETTVKWSAKPTKGTVLLGTVRATANGLLTANLNTAGVAVVQKWLNTPSKNYGFYLLHSANTDTMAFDSREKTTATLRPKLTVTYKPPVITSGPTVSSITATTATVVWETDTYAKSKIKYRKQGTATWTTKTVTTKLTSGIWKATASLTGLTANTTYEFQVQASADATWTSPRTFKTPASVSAGVAPEAPPADLVLDAPAGFALALASDAATVEGAAITIPINLTVGTGDIAGLAFSLDYDQTWLGFDAADADEDGLPDAIAFNFPGDFAATVTWDPVAVDGELTIVLSDLNHEALIGFDTAILTVTLSQHGTRPAGNRLMGFAFDSPPILRDPAGNSYLVAAESGAASDR